jgi:hypothetical protein
MKPVNHFLQIRLDPGSLTFVLLIFIVLHKGPLDGTSVPVILFVYPFPDETGLENREYGRRDPSH